MEWEDELDVLILSGQAQAAKDMEGFNQQGRLLGHLWVQ